VAAVGGDLDPGEDDLLDAARSGGDQSGREGTTAPFLSTKPPLLDVCGTASISRALVTDGFPKEGEMGFDQYHEPADELSAETRTFARMIASLTEEAEAINWYAQRMSLEPDSEARAIMENAQAEEFKHFGMDLEFLLRRTPKWRVALQTILFSEGDIVEQGEKAEDAEGL
jgi:uncharacterized protein